MKKRIALDVIAIIALIGAFVVQYYTDRKLGMVRWLNFNSAQLHDKYPLEMIKFIAAGLIMVLAVLALFGFVKNRSGASALDWLGELFMCAVVLYYLKTSATLTASVAILLVPLYGLAALLLSIGGLTRVSDLKKSAGDIDMPGRLF